MTSTLFVEEIKGRTTGTNANKVIVPSGQKLEAHTLSGTSTVEAGAKIAGTDTGSLTAPGVFINAVSAIKTDSQANASSNSFSDIVGLSVTITPKSTGSKILLLCNISLSCSDDATGRSFRCLRNGTHIGGGSEGSRKSVNFFASPMSTDQNMSGTTSWHYLDSPSSTSALTYKIQMTGYNSGVTTYINTNMSRGGQVYDDIATSNFTAIEIAG
tara:strand:+ start:713 stop:1354 length:642 start_codon:yes stop_codon:yes gene_type:complete